MPTAPVFSEPLTQHAWAKYDAQKMTGSNWYPLYAHLEDTAEVARRLYDTWLSTSQRALLADSLGGERLAKGLSVWLGAAHDVGKATSAFAMKSEECRSRMQRQGFHFPFPDPSPADQRQYPHGFAGQLAVESFLADKAEGKRAFRAAHRFAEIVGGHHGVFPTEDRAPYSFAHEEDPCWGRVRNDLLRRADGLAELDENDWHLILDARISEPVQAILTGFLIVCDWIASNQFYFPFDDPRNPSERAEDALRRLRFGDHWQARGLSDIADYFSTRFGIDEPRSVQRAAAELVSSLQEPALLLVEAPTGEGKTELAFAAAEIFAERFGLHGAMVALPTRATANAMFGRTLEWLSSGAASRREVSASLAHSKAQFDERYQGLFRAVSADEVSRGTRCIHDESLTESERYEAVVANQWFSGRKRSGFADFVVGTIDQLLFMTLKAKHLVLRHLANSGKVVIVDEIHAADDFMNTYLLRALEWLGAYGVPVIALSATLPPAQRRALLQAYRRGTIQGGRSSKYEEDVESDAQIAAFVDTEAYPLLTVIGAEQAAQIAPEASPRRIEYLLEEVEDDRLVEAVLREARDGGCIAVVCNTVRRAQKVFEALKIRDEGPVKLFHSRFTTESRNEREQALIEQLGRGSALRPQRLIVVATQVVESSLDVDFDLMFTDIAPIDLLIQRIGRVHRHERAPEERPASMRMPRVIITGGAHLLSGAEMPEFDSGVTRVYGESKLLRTAAALRRTAARVGRSGLRVPEDVPQLIRDAYREELDSFVGWETRQIAADREQAEIVRSQQERSRAFVIDSPGVGQIVEWARHSYAEASEQGEHLGAAQVRDAELSIEVVLVQRAGGSRCSLPWLGDGFGGAPVDLLGGIEEDLARAVATCTVALPSWMTRGSALDRVLDELERNGIESWQRSVWLRGMLPLVLDEEFRTVVNGYALRYDREVGLVVDGKETA